MSGRLRILHAIRSDGFAGVEQFVLRLAVAQAADGHEVAVIGGATKRMRPRLDEAGVAHTPAARTLEVFRAVRRLAARVDVVNSHMTAADVAAVAAVATVRRPRPPVVATRHFAKARGRLGPVPIGAIVRHGIAAQISISSAVADAVDGASTVVHPGIEAPASVPDHRERIVLLAQRMEPEKHTHIGIRAFVASGLAREGWTLELAGDGSEREGLVELAGSLGLEAVRFLGFRSDLQAIMDRAGILLAPCPNEGFGLALLEAMASGLPAVAADASGHAEILAGLDPRSRFAPDDVDEAARQLRALAEDDAGRAALADAARERQQRLFSLRAQADATEAVYRSVVR